MYSNPLKGPHRTCGSARAKPNVASKCKLLKYPGAIFRPHGNSCSSRSGLTSCSSVRAPTTSIAHARYVTYVIAHLDGFLLGQERLVTASACVSEWVQNR